MWAHDFRVFFTPLFGVLFTFPSRYWFAVGLSVVFSLAGWSPQIHAEFLVLRATQVPARRSSRFRVRASHPLRGAFPGRFPYRSLLLCRGSYNPGCRLDGAGLGSCAFARHYSRNHVCFLFLRVLRCFSSPGSPHPQGWWPRRRGRVAPFGNPRVSGYLPLSAAYRSLSRPSSPPRAIGILHAPFSPFLVPSRRKRAFALSFFFFYNEFARFEIYCCLFSLRIVSVHHVNVLFPG